MHARHRDIREDAGRTVRLLHALLDPAGGSGKRVNEYTCARESTAGIHSSANTSNAPHEVAAVLFAPLGRVHCTEIFARVRRLNHANTIHARDRRCEKNVLNPCSRIKASPLRMVWSLKARLLLVMRRLTPSWGTLPARVWLTAHNGKRLIMSTGSTSQKTRAKICGENVHRHSFHLM